MDRPSNSRSGEAAFIGKSENSGSTVLLWMLCLGCKCEVVVIQEGHRVARSWRYTKPSVTRSLLVLRECVHVRAMHMFYVRVPCASLCSIYFFGICRCSHFTYFWCFCLDVVSLLELCRCPSDLLLSNRPRSTYRIGNRVVYYRVWLRSNRYMYRTHTHTRTVDVVNIHLKPV